MKDLQVFLYDPFNLSLGLKILQQKLRLEQTGLIERVSNVSLNICIRWWIQGSMYAPVLKGDSYLFIY